MFYPFFLFSEDEDSIVYSFGITSLVDKKVFVQAGDVCEFQVGSLKDGEERAMNIKAVRDRIKATVEALKGQYGFLSHEVEEGKKLFFHKSEVKDNNMLKAGDVVDFVIIKNHRNGRFSACDVKLIRYFILMFPYIMSNALRNPVRQSLRTIKK